jgi:hypothetical protein
VGRDPLRNPRGRHRIATADARQSVRVRHRDGTEAPACPDLECQAALPVRNDLEPTPGERPGPIPRPHRRWSPGPQRPQSLGLPRSGLLATPRHDVVAQPVKSADGLLGGVAHDRPHLGSYRPDSDTRPPRRRWTPTRTSGRTQRTKPGRPWRKRWRPMCAACAPRSPNDSVCAGQGVDDGRVDLYAGFCDRGASRHCPGRRPSIYACRRRQALAVYPQARAGSPRTPAQAATEVAALMTLLRVGFT